MQREIFAFGIYALEILLEVLASGEYFNKVLNYNNR